MAGEHSNPSDPGRQADAAPAHRPSRRGEIIEAAIRQFARQGYTDASMTDVADDAGVAVTAVYYHFSGKEELYGAAVREVFASISSTVAAARAGWDGNAVDPSPTELLDDVIDAVWAWVDEHPDEATLLYLQLPGATRQSTALRQEFEEQHAHQAFDYFGGDQRGRTPAQRRAFQALSARTLVDLLISIHTMRLADGPLSHEQGAELRLAVQQVAARLVGA